MNLILKNCESTNKYNMILDKYSLLIIIIIKMKKMIIVIIETGYLCLDNIT
jgi:hypothetical protein